MPNKHFFKKLLRHDTMRKIYLSISPFSMAKAVNAEALWRSSFCIRFVEGEAMLMLLNSQGVAVTSGSACTSRALKASHVLIAMGIPHELAQGSILFSFGLNNTVEDINYVLQVLPRIVFRLRQISPLYDKFAKESKKRF